MTRNTYISASKQKKRAGSTGVTCALLFTTKMEKGITRAATQTSMQISPPISFPGPEMQQPHRKRLFPGHTSCSFTIDIITLNSLTFLLLIFENL